VRVIFAEAAAQVFAELPEPVRRRAARSIDLLENHPRMYPVRKRGLMRGYRYFVAHQHLFYYDETSEEVRITAIIPGVMRQA